MSYAIINKRTKKYVYGTDYSRDHVTKDGKHTKNQFTSFGSALCMQIYEEQNVVLNIVGAVRATKFKK